MRDGFTIRTNNVPRDIIEGYELSAGERAEFDYIDWQAVEAGEASPQFFRYRGELYDLAEFSYNSTLPGPMDNPLARWGGYRSDSFFSGLVIRYCDDFERVVVGLYLT